MVCLLVGIINSEMDIKKRRIIQLKKNNLLNKDDIKDLINDALFNKGIISEEVYLKCGKPKYISDLPGDLRSTNIEVLDERLDSIQKLQEDAFNEFEEKYSEYEKAFADEKESRDKILQVGEDMEEVINAVYEEVTENMGWDAYTLTSEPMEYEDEETGEVYEDIDDELAGWYSQFWDTLQDAHKEFPQFNQASKDRLIRGDENAPTYRNRMENLIDDLVNSLENGGVGAYLDSWVTDDLKLIQNGIINTIPTEADKMDKASEKVNTLRNELEDIRKKQNTLRGEYDRTLQHRLDVSMSQR